MADQNKAACATTEEIVELTQVEASNVQGGGIIKLLVTGARSLFFRS